MEKKIADDHHHHQASISSSSVVSSSRPSLKIRIRITPEIRKQLMKFEKEEKEAVKQINVKSEVKVEEEFVKEINVKSEAVKEEEAVVIPAEVVKESIQVHHQAKQEVLLVDCSSSSSFELKLEATKRKFHDSYQQIANAKRQRRIQLIDPRNLTKPAAAAAAAAGGGKSKFAGTAKSRILNVIQSNKRTNNNNRFNLFSASRSTLLKPSYIC